MKNKALILLEALLVGITVDLDLGGGNVYKVTIEDNKLCTIARRFEANEPLDESEGEDVLLGLDMTVDWFLEVANRIPDDQIAIISANLALNRIKGKKKERL